MILSKSPTTLPAGFPKLLEAIKARVRVAQTRAMQAVNAELVQVYWDIGKLIDARQRAEGWGAGVIPKLASAIKNDLPEVKGFSERNIKRMLAFYRVYPSVAGSQETSTTPMTQLIVPQAVAQFPAPILWSIPWAHHVILMEQVKDADSRLWYMQQTLTNGWSRNVLLTMIRSAAHRRQGKAVSNFERLLPPPQSDLARQALKDPYIFDFLTLDEPFRERELETNLLHHLQRFLLELGQGFAFVGRQLRLEVGEDDFFIDLLFYHLKLRCFVVADLKVGEFKPEYAGKMNFYLSVVDDKLRHEADAPSIGLILCQDRNHVIAEYALRGVNKPIGVSEYELTRALPPMLRSALPTVEEIESELAEPASAKGVSLATKKPTARKPGRGAVKKQPKRKPQK